MTRPRSPRVPSARLRPPGGPGRLHVLIVDDSAVVREFVGQILEVEGGMSVDRAPDPVVAMERVRRRRPDVIVLDLEMPKMNGLAFLKKVMAEDPLPVVICSGHTGTGTEAAIRALEEGAVDIIEKPTLGLQKFLLDSAARLVDTVRAAAQARTARRQALATITPAAKIGAVSRRSLFCVGASTGGTEALHVFLEALPEDAPAVAVVQHMPAAFTGGFAARLDQLCRVEVKEASDGDRLLPGRALIAPGDKHLLIHRVGAQYRVALSSEPPVSRHRPSVDVLFESAARAVGPLAVGILMTGMGADGAEGLLKMRQAGAATLAQDEATSVVFGMPKEAIERGAVEEIVPLQELAKAALRRAQ